MEYIEGESLNDYIRNQNLNFFKIAALIKQVAEALYIAHQHGIIHCDLKPKNIMVDRSGQPKVMDFGLAKVVDTSISQSSDLLGTPAYMSPEQAGGEKHY